MLYYGAASMVGGTGGLLPVLAYADTNLHGTKNRGKSDDIHDQPALRCSFCDKHERDAKYLIVRDEVGICEACVALCSEILDGTAEKRGDA